MQNAKKNSILVFLLFLVGCSSQSFVLDPKIYYVRDLKIKALGIWHEGVGSIGYRKEYEFKIKSPGRMSTLLIKTCHRSIKIEDAGKREKITFKLQEGVEGVYGCNAIRFSSFDDKKNKHAEGMLLIRTDDFQMPFELQCNGKTKRERATNICQAEKGKWQRIRFKEKVLMVSEKNSESMTSVPEACDIEQKEAKEEFLFQIPPRECHFIFVNPKTLQESYLFTIGPEEMIIRN